jgi:hypothetical protein
MDFRNSPGRALRETQEILYRSGRIIPADCEVQWRLRARGASQIAINHASMFIRCSDCGTIVSGHDVVRRHPVGSYLISKRGSKSTMIEAG